MKFLFTNLLQFTVCFILIQIEISMGITKWNEWIAMTFIWIQIYGVAFLIDRFHDNVIINMIK